MQSSTPGQQALVEAMRLEQASIYSQRQIEHRNVEHVDELEQLANVTPIDSARRRRTA